MYRDKPKCDLSNNVTADDLDYHLKVFFQQLTGNLSGARLANNNVRFQSVFLASPLILYFFMQKLKLCDVKIVFVKRTMLITAERGIVEPVDCADSEVSVVVTDEHSVMTVE